MDRGTPGDKYQFFRSWGKREVLDIVDVVKGQYIADESYRRDQRLRIILYLYTSEIHPKSWLVTLGLSELDLVAFYFNILYMERFRSRAAVVDSLVPIICSKLRVFHVKVSPYLKYGNDYVLKWLRRTI